MLVDLSFLISITLPSEFEATHSRLQEVELGFMVQLRRILARDAKDDLVLKGLRSVVVVDGDGEVCGICLEEMKQACETKAMDCMHRFHPSWIAQWLSRKKNTCPLCRHQMQIH
ncbi:E3 ubiquitin-protein ligase MPSR1-like [Ricinus communis]|uniref:E3 ubiquitin-protein ligase MPSR1-like n=1 Tax=Ricinus communis TaxID=3988 RepID=UPI00201AA7EE|nr:E3 ubiquitin-protein ligase MPSR1-like [Ricinus communis]